MFVVFNCHYLDESKGERIPEVDVNIITLNEHLPMQKDCYAEFQRETVDDLTLLLNIVLSGRPGFRQNLPTSLIPYWAFRDKISHVDGLMFIGSKLLILNNWKCRTQFTNLILELWCTITEHATVCTSLARQHKFSVIFVLKFKIQTLKNQWCVQNCQTVHCLRLNPPYLYSSTIIIYSPLITTWSGF